MARRAQAGFSMRMPRSVNSAISHPNANWWRDSLMRRASWIAAARSAASGVILTNLPICRNRGEGQNPFDVAHAAL
jgi:hypothetical protein